MQQTSSTSTGFLSILSILFIGLKLGGVITWSWWWVLAPLWGGMALLLAIIAVVIVVLGIISVVKKSR